MENTDHQTTKVNQYTKVFKWDIEDFNILYPNVFLEESLSVKERNALISSRAKYLLGPKFVLEMDSITTEWSLRIWLATFTGPSGPSIETPIYFNTALRLESTKKTGTNSQVRKAIESTAVLYFYNNLNQPVGTAEAIALNLRKNSEIQWKSLTTLKKLWKRREYYFPDNILRIRVKICTTGEIIHRNIARSPKKAVDLSTSLVSDLSTLFDSGAGADFTIICGLETFKVHKVILTARSPVFAGMFESKSKETVDSLVTIEDIEPEIVKHLLLYVYTSKLNEKSIKVEELQGLAHAADKYMLVDLKEKCFQLLLDKLDQTNCGDLAILLYFHSNDLTAKQFVYDYCHKYWKELIEKDSFKKLLNDCPAAFLKP